MTQEEKELLVKDLSARQIYGVKALISSLWNKDKESEECITDSIYCVMRDGYVNTDTIDSDIPIENVKPYLRRLSSMTEDEKEEYHKLCDIYYDLCFDTVDSIDWLNKKMFAYRTIDGKDMFELRLALEAPEGMYSLKK